MKSPPIKRHICFFVFPYKCIKHNFYCRYMIVFIKNIVQRYRFYSTTTFTFERIINKISRFNMNFSITSTIFYTFIIYRITRIPLNEVVDSFKGDKL